MEYFNYNGKVIEENKTVINVNNRGLRYGDGLFETIKCKSGKLILADDHFDRLWAGMKILQLNIPAHLSNARLHAEIQELVKKNNHSNSARIRLTVFRGDGGLYDDTTHAFNYLIQTWALPEARDAWNSNGLVLGIYNDAKKSCDILSNLKHNNFLPYVMAALYAKKQKWNDAVVLNTSGRICDTAIANIFIVKNEIIYTPSLDEGCIAGVMRKNIMSRLYKNNMQVKEKKISVQDLLNAEEVFLTNSIYNMQWVQRIGAINYSNTYIQKIYSAVSQTI